MTSPCLRTPQYAYYPYWPARVHPPEVAIERKLDLPKVRILATIPFLVGYVHRTESFGMQARGTGPGLVLVEFLGSHNWGWVDRRKLAPFTIGGKVVSVHSAFVLVGP